MVPGLLNEEVPGRVEEVALQKQHDVSLLLPHLRVSLLTR